MALIFFFQSLIILDTYILDKAVCISHSANTFRKGMNLARFFHLDMAASLTPNLNLLNSAKKKKLTLCCIHIKTFCSYLLDKLVK